MLHVISLDHYVIVAARGWAANSINAQVRLAADNNQLKEETQLLREELRIKDTRMAKMDPCRQPCYPVAFHFRRRSRSPSGSIPRADDGLAQGKTMP